MRVSATSQHRATGTSLWLLPRLLPRLLIAPICAALLAPWHGSGAATPGWERLEPARELLAGRTPVVGAITLDLPLVSEDGSAVPMTLSVQSPMTAQQHVSAVHVFAARNPTPRIAVFRFSPLAGRAEVSTRIRLNETQSVVAIALMSDGSVHAAEREVRVTVSGCLFRAQGVDGTHMHTRVKVDPPARRGAPAEVRTLINHPMETGLRTDADGKPLPVNILTGLTVTFEGDTVFEADLFRSMSANPFLKFFVAPPRAGAIEFTWTEDTGESVRARADATPG